MGFAPSGGGTPDNVTIGINLQGKLEVKDEGVETTQIADDAVTTDKLADGAVTTDKISFDARGMGWEFIESLTPSGVASITSAELPVYDEYQVISVVNGSAASYLALRCNGDNGNNYYQNYMNNTTPTNISPSNEVLLCSMNVDMITLSHAVLGGKTRAMATGLLPVAIIGCHAQNAYTGIGGCWRGGNNIQLSTITFKTGTGTMTGTIEIFGRNRL